MEQADQSKVWLLLPSRLNLQSGIQELKLSQCRHKTTVQIFRAKPQHVGVFVSYWLSRAWKHTWKPGRTKPYSPGFFVGFGFGFFLPAFQETFISDFTVPTSSCCQRTAHYKIRIRGSYAITKIFWGMRWMEYRSSSRYKYFNSWIIFLKSQTASRSSIFPPVMGEEFALWVLLPQSEGFTE